MGKSLSSNENFGILFLCDSQKETQAKNQLVTMMGSMFYVCK